MFHAKSPQTPVCPAKGQWIARLPTGSEGDLAEVRPIPPMATRTFCQLLCPGRSPSPGNPRYLDDVRNSGHDVRTHGPGGGGGGISWTGPMEFRTGPGLLELARVLPDRAQEPPEPI